jgi:hypothetical protein
VTTRAVTTSNAASVHVDCIVIGVPRSPAGPVLAPGTDAVNDAFGGTLAEAVGILGMTGTEGEIPKPLSPTGIAPKRQVLLFAEQRFTGWRRERGGPRGGDFRNIPAPPVCRRGHTRGRGRRAPRSVLYRGRLRTGHQSPCQCGLASWVARK